MSLYQWAACIDGVNEANDGDSVEAPTEDEFLAAKQAHGDA
jgi:hypothetical protein